MRFQSFFQTLSGSPCVVAFGQKLNRRLAVGLTACAVALGVVSTPAFGQAATTTALTMASAGTAVASGGSIVSPAQLTLTATVLAGATPVTKGTVTFCVTGAKICSDVNLIGSAQLTTAGTATFTFVPPISKLNNGTSIPFSYTAVFVGTTTDAKSSSAASTITVTGTFPTTSVLTSVQTATNPPPYIYTLTDTVTGSTQNYPTGTVSFQDTSDGNYVLGTAPIVTGSSTFVLTPKPLVPSSTYPRYVAVGDLNGDGIPDIAVADFYLNTSVTPNSSTVDIFFGKGDGTFTAGPLLSIGATFGPQFAVLGDFNNDGCLDVLAESYANNDILLFLNTKTAGVCSGTFQAVKTYTPTGLSGPGGLAVGDFNRDGNLDFVVNNNNAVGGTTSNQGTESLVIFGDGSGNFTNLNAPVVLAPGGTVNPVFTAVGDFNGDGYPDLAIANDVSSTIDIYLNNGTGGFTLKTTIATPVTNNIVLAADFNQDGKLDLAAESGVTTNPITIWLGNGDGTFTQGTSPPVGAVSVASAAEADFNGDGISDLIYNTTNSTAGGQIGVLLGKGDGTFTAPTTTYSTLGKDSLSLAVGDFNGDGYSDVVIGNYSGDLATPQADPNGVLGIYLSGYQTTGTATANLPGVTLYGASVNPHLVDAVFPTGPIYSTSTSNTVQLIPNILPPTAPNETLTMTATPNSTVYGQQVGLQATFTYQNILAASYQPNGEAVTFYQVSGTGAVTVLGTATFGTTANPGCTTTLVGGIATATCITTPLLNTTALPIGSDKVEASFNLVAPPALPTAPGTNGADLNFSGLISPTIPVTVAQVPGTGDAVIANPSTLPYGSPTTLTFCIPVGTGQYLGAAVPTGTVQFSYGTPATSINTPVTIGTTPTNETIGGTVTSCYIAQTTTSTLPLGTDTVAGTFTPGATSGYAAPSPAPTTPVVVTPVTPTSTVTTNPVNGTAPACGTSVTLTDTLTQVNSTAFSGTVQFYDNGTAIGGAIPVSAGGTASYPTTALACGANNITAIFTPAAGSPYSTSTGGPTPITLGADAITFPALPNTAFGSTPPVPAATATNTATPVTYSSTSTACSVTSAGVITFNNAGSCAITASQAAGPGYAAPTPLTNTFQITPVTPPSTLTPPTGTPACGASTTLTDTITSVGGYTVAGTVQFYDNGTAIGTPVTVGAGGKASLTTTALSCGANSVTAIFTPTAGGPYNPSTAGPTSFPVGADAITFPALPNTAFGSTPPVPAATATNTATPVTYSSTSTACSVTSAGVITFNNAGSCAITASQAAGPGYAAPTPLTNTFQITPVTPPSTLTPPGTTPACGASTTLTDTITSVGGYTVAGTVQFYDNGTAIGTPVTVGVGGTASLTTTALSCGANSVTAIFTPTAGGPYNPSTAGPTSFPVGADAITFPALPNTAFGSTPPVPAATATNTATPVTYSSTSTACSVTSAGVITFNNAGSCAITASQAAGPGYAAPTPLTNTFQITPVTPPSTLTPPGTTPACGASTTLTDTITSVGGYTVAGTVQFYDNGTPIGAPVTVGVGGTASLTTTALSCGANSVTAIFTPTAGGPYNPSTAGPTSFPVGADAITFPALPNTAFGSTPPVPAATATNTATPVTYSSTSTACSVTSAGVITFNNAGSCAITASQAAGPGYAAPTPLTNTFQITPVTPPSTLTPPGTTPACGASTTLTDTITSVGGYTVAGTVQFYDNGTAIGTPVTVGAGGKASLTTTALSCGANSVTAIFTPTAGGPYNPSTAGPTSFPVGADAITFPALPNTPYGSTPPVPAATATNTATPVTYSSTSTACSVTSAGVITFNNAGSCAITASQAAGPGYAAPTPLTNTFQITPVSPPSVITPPAAPPACGVSTTLTDTITSVGGYTVAGTVQFYDNGVAIGSPITVAVGSTASLTTTALTCGASNSITAVFTPTAGGPYTPSTAGPTPVAVAAADFTIAATPPNQVVNPGDSAVYTVSLSGVTVPFTSPVALTATCNCQGVTISFANATVTPGQGPTTTTMTVATSPTFAMSKPSHGANQIFYGLLLLPLLGLGKVRRKLRSLPKGISYCLAALVLLGGLGAVTGCGGGYYGPQPKTCTVTITGTSGTLTHSTTVTVTVR